ncbi:MAG: hypothetical protein HY686_03720 [Chloroflexi bacterium]|nr:hypothetical protein [Chloroflexota bacterium]
MARILWVGTHASDDPTRAAFPFIGASGSVEAGHQPTVALLGDAVLLLKDVIAQNVTPVGWPSLKELIGQVVQHKTPIVV